MKFLKKRCLKLIQKNNKESSELAKHSVSFKDPEVDKIAIINPESTQSFLIPVIDLKKQLVDLSKNKTFSEYSDIKNWI